MRAIIVGILITVTSSLSWADGFRPGTEPWGYKQAAPGGAWYRPGTDPYPGNDRWYGPEYRSTSSGYYRPGTDPYPGNTRWGRGRGSSGEIAAFIIGGLLGYYLGDRHDNKPAPQTQPAAGLYCPQCGQKASGANANFCSGCGAQLRPGQTTTPSPPSGGIPSCVGGSEINPSPY